MKKIIVNNLQIKLKENDNILVQNANFELKSGEIILIQGVNGGGKSSLFSGIFKHPAFEIVSGDIILKDEEKENISLIDKKTFELAKLGLYLSLQHVPEIQGVSLIQFLYRSYKNINSVSEKSILDFQKDIFNFCEKYKIDSSFLKRDLNVGFSGGEKKQAEMLHIFALSPEFVFMDEIDSGVDKEAIKKVFSIINDFNKEKDMAFCLISHKENIKNDIKIYKEYEMINKELILK